MKCQTCSNEISDVSMPCPQCGQPPVAGLVTKALTDVQQSSAGNNAAGEIRTGLYDDSNRPDIEESLPQESPPVPPIEKTNWMPKRNKVKEWAITKELNHYEALELDETASEPELNARIEALDQRLKLWAGQLDASLQELGKEGRRRLKEMKAAFSDRPGYDKQVKGERHQRVTAKIEKKAWEFVERDKVLQSDEWQSLKREAQAEGLTTGELERIVNGLKSKGVFIGITVAGQEVRTLSELKQACAGKADGLAELLWNGSLQDWLQRVALEHDLAEEASRIKSAFESNKQLGAQVWLWSTGEKRLILEGADGEIAVESVKQWTDGVTSKVFEHPSARALDDGRLEHWLHRALNRKDLAAIAARLKGKGLEGLRELVTRIVLKEESTEVLPDIFEEKGSSPLPTNGSSPDIKQIKRGSERQEVEVVDIPKKEPEQVTAAQIEKKVTFWQGNKWLLALYAAVAVLLFFIVFLLWFNPPKYAHIKLDPLESQLRKEVSEFEKTVKDKICNGSIERGGTVDQVLAGLNRNQEIMSGKAALERLLEKHELKIRIEFTRDKIASWLSECASSR